MWPVRSARRYEAVAGDEAEVKDGEATTVPRTRPVWRSLWFIGGATAAALTIALLAILALRPSPPTSSLDKPPPSATSEPSSSTPTPAPPAACPIRREWRTLTPTDQRAYISAVLCLRTHPSTLHLTNPDKTANLTRYADFPYIHSHVGYFTHNSAPFLPWHRYFLHIYEQALRDTCGYTGSLVYWDWTLDSDALETSPVFDAETGFGGDGQVGGEVTVGRTGRCLVDGPFAGVEVEYYDVRWQPHCLSRGFRDLEGRLGHMDGHDISPESIEEVLELGDYEQFVALMESRVHDAIPFGIAGDFETFTAPYDPLFFLHHTQLDRLWWLWQQRQPNRGLTAYGGHKQRHSMEMASLEDTIEMHGLAIDVKVREVMDVEGELLCYSY